jgi:hypothetical protein
MARKKTPPEQERMRSNLGKRLQQIRVKLYGEHGGPKVAEQLGIPARSWYNYEVGVTVPGDLLLRFIELTSVDPLWLLHGKGERFKSKSTHLPLDCTSTLASVPAQESIGKDSSVDSFIRHVWGVIENGELNVTWKVKKRGE